MGKLRAWLAALVLTACEPGVCPSNTMQIGERCILKPHAGSMRRKNFSITLEGAAGGVGWKTEPVALPVGTMRADGESCAGDADCASGHCNAVCCAKGSECCRSTEDCTRFAKGVGMSCEDRARCRG